MKWLVVLLALLGGLATYLTVGLGAGSQPGMAEQSRPDEERQDSGKMPVDRAGSRDVEAEIGGDRRQVPDAAREDAPLGRSESGIIGVPPPDETRYVVKQIRRKYVLPDPALQPDAQSWRDLADKWSALAAEIGALKLEKNKVAADAAMRLLAAGKETARYWADEYPPPEPGEEETRPWIKFQRSRTESYVVSHERDKASGRAVVRVVQLPIGSDPNLDRIESQLAMIRERRTILIAAAFGRYGPTQEKM